MNVTRTIGWAYLGQVPYQTALHLQSQILKRHQQRATPGVLLLLEHPPTFTVGRRSHAAAAVEPVLALSERARLEATGAAYFESLRGGLITFHGPGQLVGYPILDLRQHQMNLKWYVCSLENMLKAALASLGIQAESTQDVGVWVERNRKIASIGFHVSQWLTSHGFALNVNVDLRWFSHIVPCGLEGKQVTSIVAEQERLASSLGTKLDHIDDTFGCTNMLPHLVRAFGDSFCSTMMPLARLDAELSALCEDASKR